MTLQAPPPAETLQYLSRLTCQPQPLSQQLEGKRGNRMEMMATEMAIVKKFMKMMQLEWIKAPLQFSQRSRRPHQRACPWIRCAYLIGMYLHVAAQRRGRLSRSKRRGGFKAWRSCGRSSVAAMISRRYTAPPQNCYGGAGSRIARRIQLGSDGARPRWIYMGLQPTQLSDQGSRTAEVPEAVSPYWESAVYCL